MEFPRVAPADEVTDDDPFAFSITAQVFKLSPLMEAVQSVLDNALSQVVDGRITPYVDAWKLAWECHPVSTGSSDAPGLNTMPEEEVER